MPKTNTKREGNNLDTHLRVFKKVLLNPKLTTLQKLILSDVISFTINGDKRYYKTSAQLAKQLGSYSTKAIQANFHPRWRSIQCKWFETQGISED